MKGKKHLCRILWVFTILNVCGGIAACLPTTPTDEPQTAATTSASVSISPTIAQPTATASPVFTPTGSPAIPTAVLPTDPQATDTPMPTTHPQASATPTPSQPCGQLIVYEGTYRRTHSLAMIDACSPETVFLTDGEGHDESPKWSPDGKYIAFLSNRGRENFREYRDIWLMDADTLAISQVTVGAGIWPHDSSFIWSPDGSEILYSSESEGENETWIVNLGDGSVRLLPELWGPFAWSPDGSKIALVTSVERRDEPPEGYDESVVTPGQLVVVRPDGERIAGGDLESLYPLHNSHEWLWAPDSQYLAVAFYASARGGGGDLELVSIEEHRLVSVRWLQDLLPSVENKAVQSLSWSSTGKEIAFVVVDFEI